MTEGRGLTYWQGDWELAISPPPRPELKLGLTYEVGFSRLGYANQVMNRKNLIG
ncbi:MAG: hypothetical protein ABIV47_27280 [Roseiflexaceae bacterium]